ncbi:DUF222 domain-containing protein [Kribbella capetownensis]|uniref:DUF222 domain-containing protein n=1 Tax=Kribbella capetownensis TaxID=1572659 RepID=A0A4R0JI13_9ACTN|nr:HNH endonuclease signature motif containing protein [Kribbella capetownensis]TCC45820.1 DUF222 domain-containing protein [Kribbella capetownensis]
MELLGERPVWSMSGAERLATLDALEAELARLQTNRLQLIAGLEEIGYAQGIGAHDTVQLLAFRYRIDRPEARRDVRLALALSKYAEVGAALPATNHSVDADQPGDPTRLDAPTQADEPGLRDDETDDRDRVTDVYLRTARAEAIVSALERVPSTVPAEDVTVAEQQLVNLARHLAPGELRKAGQRIRDILDTDGPEPDERKAYDRESLSLFTAPNGVKFRGYLANENAELLRSLIHAGARPNRTIDGQLDPRPRDKRQADALTTTLSIAATAYDTTPTHPRKPSTTPTTNAAQSVDTPATKTNSRAHTTPAGKDTTGEAGLDANPGNATGSDPNPADAAADPDHNPGNGAAGADGTSGDRAAGAVPGFGAKATITVTIDLQDLTSAAADATGDLVYGDGLSAAAIRRLACDAKIIPLVLGSNSEPLDVGRAERLVNRAMRRALNARDKGCVVCGAPPIQCDAHHVRSWIDGGPTAVSNLALLCRRHHIDLHAGDWSITITNGVVHVSRPTWADPPPRPTTRPPHQPIAHTPPHSHARTPLVPPAHGTPGSPADTESVVSGAPADTESVVSGAPADTESVVSGAPADTESVPSGSPPAPAPPSRTPQSSAASSPLQLVPETPTPPAFRGAPIAPLEPETPASPTAVSTTSARRSPDRMAPGIGLLYRLLRAESENAGGTTLSSLREAASLAIWGEPTQPDQPATPDKLSPDDQPSALPDDHPFDPWHQPTLTSKHAP